MARRGKTELKKPEPNNTEPNKVKSKTLATPPAEAAPTMEELHYSLARKLMLFMSDWRRCPRRPCRRRRACAALDLECFAPRRAARPMTRDREAAAMAHVKRAVKRRLAEIGEDNEIGR